jgi:hypothetical protein
MSDLSEMSNPLKTEALMESQRGEVLRIHATDHSMFAGSLCTQYQLLHELCPNAVSAPGWVYMDRVLDRIPIDRPRPKITEGRKAGDVVLLRRNNDRIPLLATGLPPI